MCARPPYGKGGVDVDAGSRPMYLKLLENPELWWSFIQKMYSIPIIRMLLTVAFASASIVVSIQPVANFFVSSGAVLGCYIFIIVLPFIYQNPHPGGFRAFRLRISRFGGSSGFFFGGYMLLAGEFGVLVGNHLRN